MDHFAGFEKLLRIHLHRTRLLRIYGPEGFVDRVAGKLSGFTWNLTREYPLCIHVTEVGEGMLKTAAFRAETGFKREQLESGRWDGVLLEEAGVKVRAALLDHGMPCLGFRIEQKLNVQILSGELERRGLLPGPWLTALKSDVLTGEPSSKKIRIRTFDGTAESTLREMEGIYRSVPGTVLAYVMDSAGDQRNVERIVALAEKADLLYIEAAFASGDSALAFERRHLTAQMAGRIARMASVSKTKLLHLSPRYKGRESELIMEARTAAGPGSRVEEGWRDLQ